MNPSEEPEKPDPVRESRSRARRPREPARRSKREPRGSPMNQQHPAEDCPVQTTPTEPSILKRPSRRGTGFHSAANIFTVRGSADRAARYLFHNCVVHHSAAIPGSAVAWVVFGVLPDPRVERGGDGLGGRSPGDGKGEDWPSIGGCLSACMFRRCASGGAVGLGWAHL